LIYNEAQLKPYRFCFLTCALRRRGISRGGRWEKIHDNNAAYAGTFAYAIRTIARIG
jgi:hypothetical protein